jgi:ribosomal protein S18 acetylase RimI-like enzyme
VYSGGNAIEDESDGSTSDRVCVPMVSVTMTQDIVIRPYDRADEDQVIDLWLKCDLVVPWNNPERDIDRKLRVSPELLLVGELRGRIIATCMAGYDGHRGWINYLAVSPRYRRRGIGARLMEEAERLLREMGCPKINLQVRASNKETMDFYESIGYKIDSVVSMGKRLEEDEPFDR